MAIKSGIPLNIALGTSGEIDAYVVATAERDVFDVIGVIANGGAVTVQLFDSSDGTVASGTAVSEEEVIADGDRFDFQPVGLSAGRHLVINTNSTFGFLSALRTNRTGSNV
jgi:hypothetical protein